MAAPFLRAVELPAVRHSQEQSRAGRHPWTLPFVPQLADGLAFDAPVTLLVGENGSGKSTLIEALAVALGMNAEGGSSHLRFSTHWEEPELGRELRVVREGARPQSDFFLRAESFFNAATALDGLAREDGRTLDFYGGRSLHERSHGESFLALILNRFGPHGLYLLDEPEAALSPQNVLVLLRRMHQLVGDGSQFVVATHSPLLLAYPGATIYELNEAGIEQIGFDAAEPVRLTRAFLNAPERFLGELLD
ncbi:AAA family ATPase [Conexibacter sp. JD483]|uniref:AAA family ATPase n=1 Tax=unclassified Conexibacter TaxID=2627773 RepID=UPI002717E833|nr:MULTISPECIES: AAA family ATPase [unclassified Conexibacter]MDO8188113.1 AAA family ATPase [Conexibacter sp. CPCC 205706]MDO8196891.1 AAA family ATPase [Conexibacter sp. CPCC 205762]MDR9370020.1 AAA family ATPase [Conexibacter sp. JD483]